MMEPITLCGAIIVIFGLWLEFESNILAVVRWIGKIKFITAVVSAPSSAQKPAYVGRMPICFAKTSPY